MTIKHGDGLRFYDADDGAGSGGRSIGGGADPNAGGSDPVGNQIPPDAKTFTQAELDKIIGERLKRERKDWETKVEEEKRKAVMTEAERLKAERDEADKRASTATEAANRRIVRAEAKAQAAAAGIKADRLDYALRLADLSSIAIGEDGQPDGVALKVAIAQVAKDFPEILMGNGMSKAGGDFSKANPSETPLTEEAIGRMSNAELRRRLPEIKAFYARR